MLTAFFDVRGMVHFKFLPQGQTINQHVHKEILQRLLCAIREKRRDLWENNTWLLHDDNAPTHTVLSKRKFLADKNITVLEQPPYLSDLAPCDFFLFPKIKSIIKGTHFSSTNAIKNAVTKELWGIPKIRSTSALIRGKPELKSALNSSGTTLKGTMYNFLIKLKQILCPQSQNFYDTPRICIFKNKRID